MFPCPAGKEIHVSVKEVTLTEMFTWAFDYVMDTGREKCSGKKSENQRYLLGAKI